MWLSLLAFFRANLMHLSGGISGRQNNAQAFLHAPPFCWCAGIRKCSSTKKVLLGNMTFLIHWQLLFQNPTQANAPAGNRNTVRRPMLHRWRDKLPGERPTALFPSSQESSHSTNKEAGCSHRSHTRGSTKHASLTDGPRALYLISRCTVCFFKYLLYFLSSRRSDVFFRFCTTPDHVQAIPRKKAMRVQEDSV